MKKFAAISFFMILILLSACLKCFAADSEAQTSITARCGEGANDSFWVANLGWHSSIIVQWQSMTEEMQQNMSFMSRFQYLEFGWGDRDFYMSSEPSLEDALHAVFSSEKSVVHIVGLSEEAFLPYIADKEVVHVMTDKPRMNDMQRFILSYMLRDQKGEVLRLAPSLYGAGWFVESKGDFSLSFTCNSWAAEAVRTAGCNIDPSLVRASTLIERLSAAKEK